jgi:hypothetical protein
MGNERKQVNYNPVFFAAGGLALFPLLQKFFPVLVSGLATLWTALTSGEPPITINNTVNNTINKSYVECGVSGTNNDGNHVYCQGWRDPKEPGNPIEYEINVNLKNSEEDVVELFLDGGNEWNGFSEFEIDFPFSIPVQPVDDLSVSRLFTVEDVSLTFDEMCPSPEGYLVAGEPPLKEEEPQLFAKKNSIP